MVQESVDVGLARISVLGTISQVHVHHPTFLHLFLDSKVQYCLLLSVVDACYACVVALLIISFYLLYHLGGKVLHGHLGVLFEEFFSFHHHLGYGLSVYLDGTVVTYFSSREFLDQFLQCRAFGQLVCVGIIYKGVGLHLHLCHGCDHLGFLQQAGIFLQGNGAHVYFLLALLKSDVLPLRDVSHEGEAHDVFACLHIRQAKLTLVVGRDTCHLCAVLGTEQHY